MTGLKSRKILAVPSSGIDGTSMLECIGKGSLIEVYDFSNSSTSLCIERDCERLSETLQNVFPGLELEEPAQMNNCRVEVLSVYRHAGELYSDVLNGLMETFSTGFLALAFAGASYAEIESVKNAMEEIASSKSVSETETGKKWGSGPSSRKDLYYESEERMVSMSIINSLNMAAASNGLAYKMFAIAPKGSPALEYARNRFLVFDSFEIMLWDVFAALERRHALPIGTEDAKAFVRFYGFFDVNQVIRTPTSSNNGNLPLGTLMREGVLNTKARIGIENSAINLGFLMTGLPGSGKTREAMHIVSELSKDSKTSIFVITPTEEWGALGDSCNLPVIRMCKDDIPINMFGCPGSSDREAFYGNLASILSSAANAGPYRNPMEKCMLNAFSRSYSLSGNPEPVSVYGEIENSIIKFHGRRTNLGIKYTKHGENIRSSLECLRQIIGRPQYCVENGLRLDSLERGAIFDLSNASNPMRPQLYALLLNQIYAIADRFDENGDNELRMLICIEEAQIIFKDPDSPVVLDLKQRIQDFRKKGIGLMLLTHNVNDIDISIRRLCQIKLYMKQAPDNAAIAAKDLIFYEQDADAITLKLKTLHSRMGALSIVSREKGERIQKGTVFIRSMDFELEQQCGSYKLPEFPKPPRAIDAEIVVTQSDKPKHNDIDSISIHFLGEEIYSSSISELPSFRPRLLEGKPYVIKIRSSKSRIVKELVENGAPKITIEL